MAGPSHIGPYTVVRPLAAGGMGEVFLARDRVDGRLVALKQLRADLAPGYAEGVEAQTRRLAGLSHPNLVTIHDVSRHDGRICIAMEYLDGHSVATLIGLRVPLPLARRVRIVEDACAGLAHAHLAGFVHADVKPANLMATTSGLVKVIDFAGPPAPSPRPTLAGTPNYLSPEQIAGRPLDQRCDIFALGAVLFELLTGAQAFPGEPAAAMRAVLRGTPPALGTHARDLPADAQAIVDRCLAKSPDHRYQDLAALGQDLAGLRGRLE